VVVDLDQAVLYMKLASVFDLGGVEVDYRWWVEESPYG
jgi:hypothetical protein